MIKTQVGPKSFVFNFSTGTTPEEILTNLMDEVLVLEEGLPKHGWRLLDIVSNVTWNIYISETLATPIDVLFKKLYVIESDCEDGSVKRAIFGATNDNILLLGLTQWDSTTKTSADIKSMGYCSFAPSRDNFYVGIVFYRILWGVKFRLSEATGYDRCSVALFVCDKWCAITKVSKTFGITDTSIVYSFGNGYDYYIENFGINGLVGIFEHRKSKDQNISSHSYVNSAMLGTAAGAATAYYEHKIRGCGVVMNDVEIYRGIYGGGTYESAKSNVIAMPAGHMTGEALSPKLHYPSYYPNMHPYSIPLALKGRNKSPFTNTPTTDRLWLYQLDSNGVNPKFRGEVCGLRCMFDNSLLWMSSAQLLGDDGITAKPHFIIPSGLIDGASSPNRTFDNQFSLLIEA